MGDGLHGLRSFSPQDEIAVSRAPPNVGKSTALPMNGRVAKQIQNGTPAGKAPQIFKNHVGNPEFQAPPKAEPTGQLPKPTFQLTRRTPEDQAPVASARFGHAKVAEPMSTVAAEEITGITDFDADFEKEGIEHFKKAEGKKYHIDEKNIIRFFDFDSKEPHHGAVAKNGFTASTSNKKIDPSKPPTLKIPNGTPPDKARAMIEAHKAFIKNIRTGHILHAPPGSKLHDVITSAIAEGTKFQADQRKALENKKPPEITETHSEPHLSPTPSISNSNEEKNEKEKTNSASMHTLTMPEIINSKLRESKEEKYLNINKEKVIEQKEIKQSENEKRDERSSTHRAEENKKTLKNQI